jgi:hypothetical protein
MTYRHEFYPRMEMVRHAIKSTVSLLRRQLPCSRGSGQLRAGTR